MRSRLAATLAAALAVATFGVRPAHLGAQAVFQLEGGGNTITGGYGSRVQFWSGAYEGWISAGYARGWRVGLFAKRPFGLDTLRLGFDAQPIGFATDLFSGGSYLLTQGAAWRRKRSTFDATVFAGATGAGAGAPFVNTARADKPLGFLVVNYRPVPSVVAQTHAIVARQQTFLESVSWKSDDGAHQLAATGGIGANKPFGAVSWRAVSEHLELRAGYTDFERGFRRADAPLPNIAEPYRENVLVTLRAPKRAMLTLGHQNFRQDDSASLGATRATVDQAVANVSLVGFNLGGGVFQTTVPEGRSLSTFNSINRSLPLGTSGTVMLFQTFRRGTAPIRTMQAELRERITSKLSVSQVFSQTGKSLSVGAGGSFQSGFTTIAFDYQNYYVPLRQPNPFMRALNLTVRLQLGNSSASLGSALDPFGRVTYSASGSTYLYVGEPAAGIQPISVRFDRYVIRGIVVDELGNPIDGAAVDFGGELAMTNSKGEFFVRLRSRRVVPLKLSFDDFLAIGNFELVNAPASVTPEEEGKGGAIRIVLRPLAASTASKQGAKLLGIQAQGAPRPSLDPRGAAPHAAKPLRPVSPSVPRAGVSAPAVLPPASTVPLPTRASLLATTTGQCVGAQAMLHEIWRGAMDASAPSRCCRGKEGWHLIMRPFPYRF